VLLPSKFSARLLSRFGRWWSSQNSHVADLLRGASIAGVLKAVSAILSFGLSVVLGRILGADAAGVYFLAVTTAMIAATIGRVGLDSAVIRIVADHASANNWAGVGSVYRTSLAIGLISSCLLATVLYFASGLLAEFVFSDATIATPIRVMAVSVVPLSLSVLVSRALLGLSCIRDSIVVLRILPTGIALAGTWLLAVQWGVNGAIAAYVIAVTVALVYGWMAWRKALARRSSADQSRKIPSPTRELLRSGTPLLIGALLQLVIQVSGTLMLGIWSETSDVSLFAIAWRTAVLISFVLFAVNTIAQPKFAELYARRDMESLAVTAGKATLLMTVCAAPVFLFFLFAPEFVMSAFGSDFASGGVALQILSVGQFVNVAAGSVGVLLVMSGHEREYRNTQIIAACVVLVLNVILIPSYGAVGAAIAAASALIVQNISFGYFVWARLGMLPIVPRFRGQRSIRGA
jgi:O-antigen/teichoic acid export membrane protein